MVGFIKLVERGRLVGRYERQAADLSLENASLKRENRELLAALDEARKSGASGQTEVQSPQQSIPSDVAELRRINRDLGEDLARVRIERDFTGNRVEREVNRLRTQYSKHMARLTELCRRRFEKLATHIRETREASVLLHEKSRYEAVLGVYLELLKEKVKVPKALVDEAKRELQSQEETCAALQVTDLEDGDFFLFPHEYPGYVAGSSSLSADEALLSEEAIASMKARAAEEARIGEGRSQMSMMMTMRSQEYPAFLGGSVTLDAEVSVPVEEDAPRVDKGKKKK